MNKIINVGLIGAGRIGKIHAKNVYLHPSLKLYAISDFYENAAKELAENFNSKTADANDLFHDENIDALIIASPTDTHADFIERASKKNIAVLCEKPIDNNIVRAKQCIDALEKYNNPCALAFNRRHDPLFQQLQTKLIDGKIGKLEMLVITSRDPSPPPVSYIKSSGGLFKDMTIHDFDIARWILNETITQVHAVGSNLVNPEIGDAGDIDTAMITMTTKSGKLCHINNSRRAIYGYDQRIEAFGSNGMLIADNVRNSPLISATTTGSEQQPLLDFFLERYEQAYINELEDFYQSIIDIDKNPLAGPKDGLKALQLAEAAIESFESNKIVNIQC